MDLDNRLVVRYFPPAYYALMAGETFKQRVKEQMEAQGLNVAELGRKSGVPYHALDKYLRREGATTSEENAKALARTLGISVDTDAEYDELKSLFYSLDETEQQFLLRSARGLAASSKDREGTR
jgi:transcriptional regulator with XRE-family HTH domain